VSQSPPSSVFVTGTDTGVGKTWVSLALMARWQAAGYRVAGMKPVASGCSRQGRRLENEDATLLRRQTSQPVPYAWVNPYAFEPPVAPHLAARERGVEIDMEAIAGAYARLAECVDLVIVEGVGGWLVPLGEHHTVADLALHLRLPVILVVAIRLGCLNHALLSAESIRAHGAQLLGWVANCNEPDALRVRENIAALKHCLRTPCLGVLPWQPSLQPTRLAACLSFESGC
jgi:dethiobiotin synthetase